MQLMNILLLTNLPKEFENKKVVRLLNHLNQELLHVNSVVSKKIHIKTFDLAVFFL